MVQLLPFQSSARVKRTPVLFTKSPTATHELAVQLTPFSSLDCAPCGTAADWTRHSPPCHRSTSSCEFAAPTAVQLEAVAHATAKNLLTDEPAGLGVCWILHRLPFHRSARSRSAPEPMTDCPTAVQAELDGQETPANKLDAAPAGFGVDWTVQAPL